jgi:hypothetical protein
MKRALFVLILLITGAIGAAAQEGSDCTICVNLAISAAVSAEGTCEATGGKGCAGVYVRTYNLAILDCPTPCKIDPIE